MLLSSSTFSFRAESVSSDDYTLKEVVVLSRQNIRSPLSSKGSVLDIYTPHTWFSWSSDTSELSLRGGLLETAMGQYFRKWLVEEGLLTENYMPQSDEIRFYANGKQRTIATAQYFSSGFLPVANIDIETHIAYDQMDPVFTPQLTFVNEQYIEDATKQMEELLPDLSQQYELISEVIDMKESEAYLNHQISDFINGDTIFTLELNKEPAMSGSLKNATSISDALVLQYNEESDSVKAAFGHELSDEQWADISYIKDVYGDVLFTAPLICVDVAHPLLQEIYNELNDDDRLFTFLCGHDSNVGSVLAALGVEDYQLPEAIERKTPIGCKLVFEKWENSGEDYIRVRLFYNSVDQLRNLSVVDLNNPPVIYEFAFSDLNKNEDGFYSFDEFMTHMKKSIIAYDELLDIYEPKSNTIPKTGIK